MVSARQWLQPQTVAPGSMQPACRTSSRVPAVLRPNLYVPRRSPAEVFTTTRQGSMAGGRQARYGTTVNMVQHERQYA